jgi:3-polyprenyl-4-hydroxybenzoate decarboxylase
MLHIPSFCFELLRHLRTDIEKIRNMHVTINQVDKDQEHARVRRQVIYQRPDTHDALLFENIADFKTSIATNTYASKR